MIGRTSTPSAPPRGRECALFRVVHVRARRQSRLRLQPRSGASTAAPGVGRGVRLPRGVIRVEEPSALASQPVRRRTGAAMANCTRPRATQSRPLASARRGRGARLWWLLWAATVGCHMVGYDSEPLTTTDDAGEPISAVDAQVVRSDAEAPPGETQTPGEGGAPAVDAAVKVQPSAPDAAAGVRPEGPAAARDASVEPMPPDEGRPGENTCRGPQACDLTCARSSDPSCAARCEDAPTCALTCAGPSAEQGSGAGPGQGPRSCQLTCDRVTTCTPACAPGSRCSVRCRDTAECFVGCEGGSACDVACEASTCAVNCAPGAACLIRCPPDAACGFWECRMGERVCANGVRACGARCPEER